MMLTFHDVTAPLPHFDLRLDCAVDTSRLALFGPSGAGKSSLLELITGMRRPASGRIELAGQILSDSNSTLALRERGIGYVPQDAVLFEHLSVEKNIRYSRTVSARDRFRGIAAEMDLEPLLPRRPRSLSGGEKRRVAIARALLAEPRLLLLDEPFAGLDHPLRDRIIASLERGGLPRILVTHIREEAIALSDNVVMLDRGTITAYGPTRELLS